MALTWEDVDVGCPYYLRMGDRTIRCEGAQGSKEVALLFDTWEKKRAVMERYCKREWGKCPYFRAADEQYAAAAPRRAPSRARPRLPS